MFNKVSSSGPLTFNFLPQAGSFGQAMKHWCFDLVTNKDVDDY